jgi:hypothetical protein
MNQTGRLLLRYVCTGCTNISCIMHRDDHKYIGAPHNCLYGTGCKWHPEVLIEGEWVQYSEQAIDVMFATEIKEATL